MKGTLIFLRQELYQLFRLRHIIVIMILLFVMNWLAFCLENDSSWGFFSIVDPERLMNNNHWLFLYIFPLILSFNWFGHVIAQQSVWVYIRIRQPRLLWILVILAMVVYIMLYVGILIVLSLFWQQAYELPLGELVYLGVNLFLTMMGMLLMETLCYCLGLGYLGLGLDLAVLVFSFYTRPEWKWAMPQPYTEEGWRMVLFRGGILLILLILSYLVFTRLSRVRRANET
ncbi:hypothetical protein [Facklamia hominis]|uniref:Uncharacterized protein n=1 Tax=Facklamia hominis CCUG 36813 TaxID=883111 RepID=K1LJL5_9LACT|nr:hypothetical protein [Facklamia hominis]EKB54791.1 hypothetical protein HMPREF9706_00981 [Facklamia hominis CCUG 36813]